MLLSTTFNEWFSNDSFHKIFKFKGEIAPIAEKSFRNIYLKNKSNTGKEQQIHYFAVGHSFKQIEKEFLFDYIPDDLEKRKVPTKFKALLQFDMDLIKSLIEVRYNEKKNKEEFKGLISDLRNINSHYVHTFENINVANVQTNVIDFIKDAFKLSVIQVYISEKETCFSELVKSLNYEHQLVLFLSRMFLPEAIDSDKKEEFRERKQYFESLQLDEAIEKLLFVELENNREWRILDDYPVFTIEQGTYLSFYACLFLQAMFLYKNEANQLISKIQGFKRNGTKEEQSKRDLFVYFAKKFTSQDINSEESHLVKFRDIVQYLNHYPVVWNKELELTSNHPAMTHALINKVITMELDRSFPEMKGNERFYVFAKYQLWGKKYLGKSIEKQYINTNLTSKETEEFFYALNTSPELEGEYKKLKDLNEAEQRAYNDRTYKRIEGEKKKVSKRIENLKSEENPVLTKLQKRITNYSLIKSNGRNQDRFMDFALRFLAEQNYFGNAAEFKMYKFYTTTEQENYLREKTNEEKDKLKYHGGRICDFSTFNNHLNRYPNWDTPFVVQNNANHIKLKFESETIVISIQRALLVYLLDDALFNNGEKNEGRGLYIFEKYYSNYLKELNGKLMVLNENNPDVLRNQTKTHFKKLIPNKLLKNYFSTQVNNTPKYSNKEKILLEAIEAEKRYDELVKKAEMENVLYDFLKRNKGKQFKLKFVRKAWQIMYFRGIYDKQVDEAGGHHKSFNITRDEYNDFCKYMFAFDTRELPQYKLYLWDLLNKKRFFENLEFKELFESGTSLNNLYEKTKQSYKKWLENNGNTEENKVEIANYYKLFNNSMLYLNKSHFISFLKEEGILLKNSEGLMLFKALENNQYLIPEFYYTETLPKDEYKTNAKLFNKLRSCRLEDVLLYEMALFYLDVDKSIVTKTKTELGKLLTQNVVFEIKKGQNKLYKLVIPFKKLDNYLQLIMQKEAQEEQYKGNSFLANVPNYLEKAKSHEDLNAIYTRYKKNWNDKKLTFDDLGKFDGHIVSSSLKFTRVAMLMEAYYIRKNGNKIERENRIFFNDIKLLNNLIKPGLRNAAYHLNIPQQTYDIMLKKIEEDFLTEEVRPVKATSFDDLTKDKRMVCEAFLNGIHNNLFNRHDKQQMRKRAKEKYFNQFIKK